MIAASEAAWRCRERLISAADTDTPDFVDGGGRYITLPAEEGDARGLQRAIAPLCDHALIDAVVGGRRDPTEPTETEPLVIEFSHSSGGLGVDVVGLTGLLHRRSLGRPPQVGADALVDALLAIAKQHKTTDYFSRNKDAVVILTSYTRAGDYVGSRRIGVIKA
jgi:hypothetical protein